MTNGPNRKKPPATKPKVARKRKTQAPGQFYGYSIQTTRLVARLLQCVPGQAVSLEVLDDVAVIGGQETVAEQSKSGLAHNPVADRSVDLWKTLFNWVEAIRFGALTTETRFALYVAQPYSGAIASRLHSIAKPTDAAPFIAGLRDEFWGEAPERDAKAALPESIAQYVNGVLEASDDTLARLFAGFELVTGSGSPSDDLTPLLKAKAIGESAVEKVLESILGWTKRRVEKLIEQRKPPIILFDEFNQQLIAAARKYDRSELLTPTPVAISESEVSDELRSRQYIQQLRWVGSTDGDLVRAVNDFLRSSAARTTWSEQGDVVEASFEEFSESLERHWENRRRLSQIEMAGRPDIEVGQVVLTHCLMATIRLQGLEVPSFFVPGSFHALADTFTVGWHPRFRDLQKNGFPADAAKDSASGDGETS